MITKLFDYLKRRAMDSYYRVHGNNSWGRGQGNQGDVDAAVRLLRGRRYKFCLDVGTGLGDYARAVAPMCDDVLALDLSVEAVMRARKALKDVTNITVTQGNIREFASVRGADLVILADMLYYLGDERFPEKFKQLIRHIAGLVAPGGRILITTHISSGRTIEQALSYSRMFESAGLREINWQLFESGKHRWAQAVLEK